MKGKKVDSEPIKDRKGTVCEAEGQYVEEGASDNVTDESFETDDNSSEVSCDPEEWEDKYLRLIAEFDNYRKRTLREKMELISTGGEDVIKSLLAVMDDIDRAVEAINNAQDVESAKAGILLIYHKLKDTLTAKGVSEIEAVGKELDTDLHEAVARMPGEASNKGKIMDVVQKGYKLNDKVVRYAKVIVGE